MKFLEDKTIEQISKAYSLDAVDFSFDRFNVKLDFSENSIKHVESILDKLHQRFLQDHPSDEQVLSISKMFGSYIGEIYRSNHGAEWGVVNQNADSFPGLRCSKNNSLFWPWGKVKSRIINGYENNVWDYYKWLVNSNRSNQNDV